MFGRCGTLVTVRRIMICGTPRFRRDCILLRFPLPIGAAKRGFTEGCTLIVNRVCHFQSDLGLHHYGDFFGSPPFFLIILTNYSPFRQINSVWCHGGMATCQVSFDVQNPRGGTAPGNRTFTGHVFLLKHGHCVLQWDHIRACATDFLAHNTCGARACSATRETGRFGLTTHPWARYHLSLLQVQCHTIAHPCPSNGHSTQQTKFYCFRRPHAGMCHPSVRLCTQPRTIWHLCGFHKGRQGAHWNEPTTMGIHLGIQKNHMPTPKLTFRTKPSHPPQQGRIAYHCDKRQKLTCHGDGMSCRKRLISGTINPCTVNGAP